MKEIKLKHKSDEQINPISDGSIREISPTYRNRPCCNRWRKIFSE